MGGGPSQGWSGGAGASKKNEFVLKMFIIIFGKDLEKEQQMGEQRYSIPSLSSLYHFTSP